MLPESALDTAKFVFNPFTDGTNM